MPHLLLSLDPAWLILAGIALFALLVQLYFFFRYFSALSFYKEKPLHRRDIVPVSVVVCVRRNMESVRKLVEALLLQEHPKFEIIIIDDRSDDDTYDYLLSLRGNPIIYHNRIEETPAGINEKKYALSLGIKAARYPYVLLTDDDCVPATPFWITEMSTRFTRGKHLVLGYSPYIKYKGVLNALIRYETFYTGLQYLGMALRGKPYMGVGRNLAYTRSLFFDFKGFYKHINVRGGDDDLFVNRASNAGNTAVCLSPESIMYSEPKHSFSEWYAQKRRHFSVSRFYKPVHQMRLGFLAAGYVVFWLSFPALAFVPELWPYTGAAFLLRQVSLVVLYSLAAKKLGEKLNPFQMLAFDFIYVFCFLYFGIAGFFSRRKSWN